MMDRPTLPPDWTLAYDSFDPEQERLREVLTSRAWNRPEYANRLPVT